MELTLFEQEIWFEDNDAIFSPDKIYRYRLTRQWDDGRCILWLMLNPSTADETTNDPTIRKCIGFSKRWGYGRLVVCNLFALRSTDPRRLSLCSDPVGPLNNYYIKTALQESREVICAWGCQEHLTTPALKNRVSEVRALIPEHMPVFNLGRRKDLAPRHPSRLSYSTVREAM